MGSAGLVTALLLPGDNGSRWRNVRADIIPVCLGDGRVIYKLQVLVYN